MAGTVSDDRPLYGIIKLDDRFRAASSADRLSSRDPNRAFDLSDSLPRSCHWQAQPPLLLQRRHPLYEMRRRHPHTYMVVAVELGRQKRQLQPAGRVALHPLDQWCRQAGHAFIWGVRLE